MRQDTGKYHTKSLYYFCHTTKLIKYKIKIRPIGGKKDLNRNILIDLELSDICFKITMISMCYGNREIGDEVLLREL